MTVPYKSLGSNRGSTKMLPDLFPTVRRYPRSMNEAFPTDIEYSQWFYRTDKKPDFWYVMAVAVGVLITCILLCLFLLLKRKY